MINSYDSAKVLVVYTLEVSNFNGITPLSGVEENQNE